jgi:long-chain acyl-CoA synthetase
VSKASSLVENRPPSAAHLLLDRVAATPDKVAYRYPVPGSDIGGGREEWRSMTWAQVMERVQAISAGLMELGILPEERVAIASATRVEWVLADFGVMCAGAAVTTVYPNTNAEETAFILADSGSRALFAENAEQLAKVLQRRSEVPELTAVILLDGDRDDDREGPTGGDAGLTVLTLAELEGRGAARLSDAPECVTKAVGQITGDQLATLIYTSGTTGHPKGVRLVHDCWSYEARAIEEIGVVFADDVQYLWLPLSHVFGKVLTSMQTTCGFSTAIDGRQDRIVANMARVSPTFMVGVPRIFEKVYNGVAGKARAGGRLKYRIFRWAAQVARDHAKTYQAAEQATGRGKVPPALAAKRALADRLVHAKVRAAFGGRMRALVSGSAALPPEIGYFFAGVGLPILEGYGLTESSAGSAINSINVRTGTAGRLFPGTEGRTAADGELLLRGPGVMRGYHNDPKLSAQVLDEDGWLHTGDIGEISEDGFLRITDRKKDLIKTSGGKYVAPSELENRFKAACPFVANILVIGNGRNFCSALIALDEPTLRAWAEQHGLGGLPHPKLLGSAQVERLIDGYVQRVNAEVQRWQTIKKFTVLPRDFDLDHGELTPSMKVKRSVVESSFATEIERMYEGARES